MAINLQKLLTIKEADSLIHVNPNTLRNWDKQGKIQSFRIGGRRDRRFTKESLWKLLKKEILV